MHVGPDLSAVMTRIQEIQSRIANLSGTPRAPSSFSDVLDSATSSARKEAAAPRAIGSLAPATPTALLDPNGNAVRPIPLSGDGDGAYDSIIAQSAQKYGVDADLIKAVIQTESSGNPRAVSRAGAMGLMQLMPANATDAGVTDPFDPGQNIDAGTQQLSTLLTKYDGNLDLALSAYNAGPGAVSKYGGVPPYPETQDYVRKIHRLLEAK